MTDVLEPTDPRTVDVSDASPTYFGLLDMYRQVKAKLADAERAAAAAVETKDRTVAEYQATNQRLSALLDAARRETVDVRTQALADGERIFDAMVEQFETAGYATFYDDAVNELDGRLTLIDVKRRIRVFNVTVPIDVKVSVEATDEDNAIDLVRDTIRTIEGLIDGSPGEYSTAGYPQFDEAEAEED